MFNLATKYPMKLLYADDNPMDQLILSRFFESIGYELDIVCDGNQALEAVANGDYDVLILDACMPLVDGIEACRIMRQREQSQGKDPILVVGVTAYDRKNKRDMFMQAGANLYYKKPLELDHIVEIVQERCGEDIRTPA